MYINSRRFDYNMYVNTRSINTMKRKLRRQWTKISSNEYMDREQIITSFSQRNCTYETFLNVHVPYTPSILHAPSENATEEITVSLRFRLHKFAHASTCDYDKDCLLSPRRYRASTVWLSYVLKVEFEIWLFY